MREIKFRGKRLDNGEWVYGYPFCSGIRAFIANFRWVDVDPVTLSQYTGLKDKNGKEVYTDHILQYTESIFTDCSQTEVEEVRDPVLIRIISYHPLASIIVPLSDEAAAFGWDLETGEGLILGDIRSEDIEIIGSIHDNPELLES